MGNCKRDSVPVSNNPSWTSVLESKITSKINLIQQFVETWRCYFMTQQFWSFSWLWTFLQMNISRLRIRLTVGPGAKRKLMTWAGACVPRPYLEKGFPACFQDGVALCALVEGLAPGACPRFDVLDPEQKARNLGLALYLIGKHLKMKPEVTAEQIQQGGKLCERQLLLLLAHMKTASETTPRPLAIGPAFPQYPPPSSDGVCSARGMGLILAVQGRRAAFCIEGPTEGVVVEMRGPMNTLVSKLIDGRAEPDIEDEEVRREVMKKRIPMECQVEGKKIFVNYTPLVSGTHHLAIIWQGRHIPGSPYAISVHRSADVPDKEVWCTMAEELKRSDSLSVGGRDDMGACQDSKGRGKIIRKKILRYIVKVDGNDVVLEDPEKLCEVVNCLRNRTEEKISGSKESTYDISSDGSKSTSINQIDKKTQIESHCSQSESYEEQTTLTTHLTEKESDEPVIERNPTLVPGVEISKRLSIDLTVDSSACIPYDERPTKIDDKSIIGIKVMEHQPKGFEGVNSSMDTISREEENSIKCQNGAFSVNSGVGINSPQVDDDDKSSHSCLSCRVICNCKYDYKDMEIPPVRNDGIFHARLAISNMEQDKRDEKENVYKEDIAKNRTECPMNLKNHIDSIDEDVESNFKDKEVLPYIKGIIRTADKLRFNHNFEEVESIEVNCEKNTLKFHKFDFSFKAKPDINCNETEMELVTDFKGSYSSDEDEIFSRSLLDTREKMDNKVNVDRERFLRDSLGESQYFNEHYSNHSDIVGEEPSGFKLRRCGNMTISSESEEDIKSERFGKNVQDISLDTEKTHMLYINSRKTEKGDMDEAPVTDFACDHAYLQYEDAEDFFPVVNLSNAREFPDDELESDFLQKIEDLNIQIKSDSTNSNDSSPESESFGGPTSSNRNDDSSNFLSKPDQDFEHIVFEIHQSDRSSQRKRSSWSDRKSLSCIRESSIEGIIDAEGHIKRLDELTNNPAQTIADCSDDSFEESYAESSTFKTQSEVYFARLVPVVDDDDDDESDGEFAGMNNGKTLASVSPVKIGHHNSGISSISLLCASPYHAKNVTASHDSHTFPEPSRMMHSTDQNNHEFLMNHMETHMENSNVNGGPNSTTNKSNNDPIEMPSHNKNHEPSDQKLSPIPSVRKVIEIFQKEQEEPLDKWPETEDVFQKRSPRRIICVSNEDHWGQENYISADIQSSSQSIKDRVRLFESPNQQQSLKIKPRVSETSKVVDKKLYWENFSH